MHTNYAKFCPMVVLIFPSVFSNVYSNRMSFVLINNSRQLPLRTWNIIGRPLHQLCYFLWIWNPIWGLKGNSHMKKCLNYFASNLLVIYITIKDTTSISILPLWTFHLYVATFPQHLHVEYIYIYISVVPISLVIPVVLNQVGDCD
jgi:hypothetical protein